MFWTAMKTHGRTCIVIACMSASPTNVYKAFYYIVKGENECIIITH